MEGMEKGQIQMSGRAAIYPWRPERCTCCFAIAFSPSLLFPTYRFPAITPSPRPQMARNVVPRSSPRSAQGGSIARTPRSDLCCGGI